MTSHEESAPNPVDAVVFDLGNVLIRWDPEPAIAAAVGPERAQAFLADASFDFGAWNAANDLGRSFLEAEESAVAAHRPRPSPTRSSASTSSPSSRTSWCPAIRFTDPEALREDLVVRGLPLRPTH